MAVLTVTDLRAREGVGAIGPGELTLAAAKRLALRENPGLVAARERVETARATVARAHAAFLPSVTASASVQHTEDTPLAPAGGQAVDPYEQYGAGLDATWVLFSSFSRSFAVQAAREGLQSADASRADAQRVLLQAVSAAYYAALLAREDILVARQDAEFNRELSEETSKRARAGTASRSEILNFDIRTVRAESAVLQAESAFRVARLALARLISVDSGVLPAEALPSGLAEETTVPQMIDTERQLDAAFARRPDLRAMDRLVAAQAARVKAARGAYGPTVAGSAYYGWIRNDNPRFNDDRDASSFLGLALEWELFAGGRRGADVAAAKAALRETAALRSQTRDGIVADVRRQAERMATARAQAELQKRVRDMTSEARDLVRNEYAAGTASLTRLNEAQTDLVRAAGAYSLARIRALLAWQNLLAATGQILDITEE